MPDPTTPLASALRDWVASLPPGTATLSALDPDAGEGERFLVTPTRPGAAAIRLWAETSPEYFTLQVGSAARWEQRPLSAATVRRMCDSVACGGFLEETWKLGSLTLARRASLIVGGESTLRWGTLNRVFPIPFSHWERRAPDAWLGEPGDPDPIGVASGRER